MLENLPSLLGFRPKFYSAGPSRFHLPLLYDLVIAGNPKSIVTLGFADGQSYFTCCQAVAGNDLNARLFAVRRSLDDGAAASNDVRWQQGKEYGEEFYGDRAHFFESENEALAQCPDQSVDLLLIDDTDRGTEIRSDLSRWERKLAPDGLLLLHGVELEREDGPGAVARELASRFQVARISSGAGLALFRNSSQRVGGIFLIDVIFDPEKLHELTACYCAIAERIDAQAGVDTLRAENAKLETRQIWLDSLLTDRAKVQEIMDHQSREIATLAEMPVRFEALLRDRAKAQLVMDSQHEELKHWVDEGERLQSQISQLKGQIKDQKRLLSAAKNACRKNGRCFQISSEPKERRTFGERIRREFRRNLRRLGLVTVPAPMPAAKDSSLPKAVPSLDRYETWILEHEPDAAALEKQRVKAREFSASPKISLLVPVHNTPATFLEEMFASVTAQTYGNWELCVVDGGSDSIETTEAVGRWTTSDPRIRFQRLTENLGIAENTNRALALATGDFVTCIDHDDLLASFALYEMARAIANQPDAEIFYSDEDRLSAEGKRHSPFFKPEWSPELLLSSMYLGHLTVYRRDLVERVGAFRKEFDLSQDYDFALRATELTSRILHVPHVLYHWREHPGSGSAGGKPDARKTNLSALADAMKRRNLPADIIEYPTTNRARLKVAQWPRVSVIVPTDSPRRAQICANDLRAQTKYPDLEIVIVANSKLTELLKLSGSANDPLRLVSYDKPFNFSEKCNLGAEASTGDRLIFFNDDVEPTQSDWVQKLIEPLENSEIGAVSPKLLYEDGKIQHAGLVMGVRGLAGTAFHQRPADSTEHFNLAQSMRNVAALSAACLAMRREDFFRIGGFDSINTPIAHSDMDLCFKVREAGLRCVYTPFATLTHTGHVSLGWEEKKSTERVRDKASIYMLKRWPEYATRDPYFTDNMRDWLHSDSPIPIRMSAGKPTTTRSSADLLFVSHDLSLSGAPMMLFHAAVWCAQHGFFVVLIAPAEGPLLEKFEEAGITVIIDPLVETEHDSFAKFGRDFDLIVANTIRSGAAVRAMNNEGVPIAWWIHEPGTVGEHYLREDAKLRAAVPMADAVIVPSERTAAVYRPFTDRPVHCLRNAIPDIADRRIARNKSETRALRFLLLGSIEPRKGQDIFVRGISLLPADLQQAAEFQIAGRVLDPDFWPPLAKVAANLQNFSVTGALSHPEAIELMRNADVIVSASRDEAMPTVTILEAMSLGKALIATTVGGALEALTEGKNALLIRPDSPEAMAAAMKRLIDDPKLVRELGDGARITYEENFTLERFGREFQQLLNEMIAPAPSSQVAQTI